MHDDKFEILTFPNIRVGGWIRLCQTSSIVDILANS